MGELCMVSWGHLVTRRDGASQKEAMLTKSTVLSLVALSTGAGVATDAVLTHTVVLAGV